MSMDIVAKQLDERSLDVVFLFLSFLKLEEDAFGFVALDER